MTLPLPVHCWWSVFHMIWNRLINFLQSQPLLQRSHVQVAHLVILGIQQDPITGSSFLNFLLDLLYPRDFQNHDEAWWYHLLVHVMFYVLLNLQYDNDQKDHPISLMQLILQDVQCQQTQRHQLHPQLHEYVYNPIHDYKQMRRKWSFLVFLLLLLLQVDCNLQFPLSLLHNEVPGKFCR